jgi:hypothetical protein
MAIDPQLLSFMPHTVTIQNYSSRNSYGEDGHSATTRTAKAYVEPTFTLSTQNTTREQSQPKRAYIADTNITLQSKITLPDGSIPEISTVEVHDTVVGIEHTIVTFL